MARLSKDKINKIIDLTEEGCSLREIKNLMNVSKSTIYYHVRSRFGRKLKKLNIRNEKTRKLGEFLGLFASDGCFIIDKKNYSYKLKISLSANQLVYSRRVCKIIKHIFNKPPMLQLDEQNKVINLVLNGKEIYGFLKQFLEWEINKSHTIKFRHETLESNKIFLAGIIDGLTIGDGGVYVPKNRIAFGSVSEILAHQYQSILNRFNIESNLYQVRYPHKKTLNHVHITGIENIMRFNRFIGLSDYSKNKLIEQIITKHQ